MATGGGGGGGGGGTLRVAVVGGGLVGALQAVLLARRGHRVDVFEYRDDVRRAPHARGRTINLTLSERGRAALRAAGLEAAVLARGQPVRGRLVHPERGPRTRSLYHPDGQQCIYSVNRKNLNELLLTAAEATPNVRLHFGHKLVAADLRAGQLTFHTPKSPEGAVHAADLVVGADGAHSAVRAAMLRLPGFEFRQSNIQHAYLELRIPPRRDGQSQLQPQDFLHVWPRGGFMLMALPNADRSWTVTLFAPAALLQRLCARPLEAVGLFWQRLPDALELIGPRELERDLAAGRPAPLTSVKCKPYHVQGKAVIVGDAAHAMVPFYGQGMNAGFEDCLLLEQLLRRHGSDLAAALAAFSAQRNPDAEAICDLAMYNYVEMRELAGRRSHRLRMRVEAALHRLAPRLWLPLYPSVAFTRRPYLWCLRNKRRQDRILESCLALGLLCGLLGLALAAFCCFRWFSAGR